MLHGPDFCSTTLISQLLLPFRCGAVVAMVAVLGENLSLTGKPDSISGILSSIDATFTLGICSHGPELLPYFSVNIHKPGYVSVMVESDDIANERQIWSLRALDLHTRGTTW